MRISIFSALLSILLLAGCTQKESSQASTDSTTPHATIVTRDGARLAGTVRSSTASEITLNLDEGGSRTILTKDVKSVDYGDAVPADKSAAAPRETRSTS